MGTFFACIGIAILLDVLVNDGDVLKSIISAFKKKD
jgi:hypothetical protein